MILLLAAALATAPPSTAGIATDVECRSRAEAEASICLATYYAGADRHADAAAEFEKAAVQLAAGGQLDPRADRALAAAGNMWIAAGQPGKAALALDKALTGTGLRAEQRGEAMLDRARAAEALNDLKTARSKVTEATQSIGDDPFLWYFSAALAVRENDAPLAKSAINRALSLAPGDPTILFEAGHVSHFAGDEPGARDYWTRAIAADPNGPSGKAARQALSMLTVPLTVQSAAGTTK